MINQDPIYKMNPGYGLSAKCVSDLRTDEAEIEMFVKTECDSAKYIEVTRIAGHPYALFCLGPDRIVAQLKLHCTYISNPL